MGGHLNVSDSLWVALQNLASNGFGLSAGLEAAYTQLSAALASRTGERMRVRREDLRILVGCGAAGAIAAAFGAPLRGAFYAFELVIGTYNTRSLVPVVAASIAAVLVSQALTGAGFGIDAGDLGVITAADIVPSVALGLLCAGLGIAVMVAVVRTEKLAKRLPMSLRLVFGGRDGRWIGADFATGDVGGARCVAPQSGT